MTIDGTTEVVNGTVVSYPDLVVGDQGSGGLQVTNAGWAYVVSAATLARGASATGYVSVEGPGSRFMTQYGGALVIGESGAGVVSVESGGELSSGGAVQLGVNTGSSGRIVVRGPGSLWSGAASQVSVGVGGFGSVSVLDGASAPANVDIDLGIGIEPTGRGEVLVAGPGSAWQPAGTIRIGVRGSGVVVVRDQGVLGVTELSLGETHISLGHEVGGSGLLSVEGAGTSFTPRDVYVGNAGDGRFEVRDGADVQAGSLYLGMAPGSSGHLRVEGEGTRLWGSTVQIGQEGAGVLEVLDGALARLDSPRIGATASGQGLLTVAGSGSRVESAGVLSVGTLGAGELSVRDGASLWAYRTEVGGNLGSEASVIVEGAGTTWTGNQLDIGFAGSGSVVVRDGARLDIFNPITLGLGANGAGTLEVLGAGTHLHTLDMRVGALGGGTFRLADGATADVRSIDVDGHGRVIIDGSSLAAGLMYGGQRDGFAQGPGRVDIVNGGSLVSGDLQMKGAPAAPSLLRVEGAGSSATFRDVMIGALSPAEVSIGPGASLTTRFNEIGRRGEGSVLVEGTGARWNSSRVAVGGNLSGGSSTGVVRVRSGGVVETTGPVGDVLVGQRAGTVGHIEVAGTGSRWRAGALAIAGSSPIAGTAAQGAGTGSARIADGGVFDASGGQVIVWKNGTLDLDGGSVLANSTEIHGRLEGEGMISGALTNRGEIAPGHSPGVLDIDGSYVQSAAGRLEIEVFGAAQGEFDRLEVSGAAILDGVLSVHLFGDPLALMGTRIDFLLADSISGTFQELQAIGIDPELLELRIDGGVATLTIIPEPASALLLAIGLLVLARFRVTLLSAQRLPPSCR